MPYEDTVIGILSKQLRNPWPAMIAGLSCTLLALIVLLASGYSPVPLVFGGLIAAGAAIAIRPQSPLVLGAAVVCGYLAYHGLPEHWDTIRLLILVLSVFATVACGLASFDASWRLLDVGHPGVPRTVRRVLVSLLIFFHFGGIATAVLNVNPSPWFTGWIWSNFYRYYLEFFYLNNAYHFYAPEPGPGTLVWFYVKYEDGTMQKVEFPKKENHALTLCYQRRLSLAESVNQLVPSGQLPHTVLAARLRAGQQDEIPLADLGLYPDPMEYRPAIPFSQRMLEAYAKRVATTTPHPTDPSIRVTGVKIYRVVHRLPNARETALGISPEEKWFYLPYYQGEYDVDGKLKNPDDPYLWWLIPIVNVKEPRLSRGVFAHGDRRALNQAPDVRDFFEVHLKLPTVTLDLPDVPAIPGGNEPGLKKP